MLLQPCEILFLIYLLPGIITNIVSVIIITIVIIIIDIIIIIIRFRSVFVVIDSVGFFHKFNVFVIDLKRSVLAMVM